MSILIKGMEMPKSCSDCPMCYDMMKCTVSPLRFWRNRPEREEFDFCTERHPTCPLVPVPPHGRLIDADKMRESIRTQTAFLRLRGGEFAEIAETLEKGFLQEIDNAPTIIPAEEEKS